METHWFVNTCYKIPVRWSLDQQIQNVPVESKVLTHEDDDGRLGLIGLTTDRVAALICTFCWEVPEDLTSGMDTVSLSLAHLVCFATDSRNVKVFLWRLKCQTSLSVVLISTATATPWQRRVRPARTRLQGNCCKGECTMPALNHTLQTQNNPRQTCKMVLEQSKTAQVWKRLQNMT